MLTPHLHFWNWRLHSIEVNGHSAASLGSTNLSPNFCNLVLISGAAVTIIACRHAWPSVFLPAMCMPKVGPDRADIRFQAFHVVAVGCRPHHQELRAWAENLVLARPSAEELDKKVRSPRHRLRVQGKPVSIFNPAPVLTSFRRCTLQFVQDAECLRRLHTLSA